MIPIVESAVDALVDDDLPRVRRCAEPRCARVFLDTSRNGTRRWCDMGTCGNRAKAARHRARTRSAPTAARSAEHGRPSHARAPGARHSAPHPGPHARARLRGLAPLARGRGRRARRATHRGGAAGAARGAHHARRDAARTRRARRARRRAGPGDPGGAASCSATPPRSTATARSSRGSPACARFSGATSRTRRTLVEERDSWRAMCEFQTRTRAMVHALLEESERAREALEAQAGTLQERMTRADARCIRKPWTRPREQRRADSMAVDRSSRVCRKRAPRCANGWPRSKRSVRSWCSWRDRLPAAGAGARQRRRRRAGCGGRTVGAAPAAQRSGAARWSGRWPSWRGAGALSWSGRRVKPPEPATPRGQIERGGARSAPPSRFRSQPPEAPAPGARSPRPAAALGRTEIRRGSSAVSAPRRA